MPILTPEGSSSPEQLAQTRLITNVGERIASGTGRRIAWLARLFEDTHGFQIQAGSFSAWSESLGVRVEPGRKVTDEDYFDVMHKKGGFYIFFQTYSFCPGINIRQYQLKMEDGKNPQVVLVTKDVHKENSYQKTVFTPNLTHLELTDDLLSSSSAYSQPSRPSRSWYNNLWTKHLSWSKG